MASRIAVRTLPLHLLHRALPRNANANASRCSSSLAASANGRTTSTHRLPGRRSSSTLSDRNRTAFASVADEATTTMNQDHHRHRRPRSSSFSRPRQTAEFHTHHSDEHHSSPDDESQRPGSVAFGECELPALSDLFLQFAKTKDSVNDGAPYLNLERIKLLLESVGEKPDEATLRALMDDIGSHEDGRLRLDCFLRAADRILGDNPARIVLVVGGPGSGKGALCERLARDCGAVHLSCGEMLREEVEADTPLGREVAGIMARGELVSSALVTALMRRRMRRHPGRRILLDGFPRSLENARDFVELCGPPELALHLDCDDTVLIERILARGGRSAKEAERAASEGKQATNNVRADDNVHTAIQRLKNYHKHHPTTMSWLKEIRVPIVELDCSGSKEDVWQQLVAIGRLMRPAVQLPQPQPRQQPSVHAAQPQNPTQQQQPQGQQMSLNGSARNDANEDMQWIA